MRSAGCAITASGVVPSGCLESLCHRLVGLFHRRSHPPGLDNKVFLSLPCRFDHFRPCRGEPSRYNTLDDSLAKISNYGPITAHIVRNCSQSVILLVISISYVFDARKLLPSVPQINHTQWTYHKFWDPSAGEVVHFCYAYVGIWCSSSPLFEIITIC